MAKKTDLTKPKYTHTAIDFLMEDGTHHLVQLAYNPETMEAEVTGKEKMSETFVVAAMKARQAFDKKIHTKGSK